MNKKTDVSFNEYTITNETIAVLHLAGGWLSSQHKYKRKSQVWEKKMVGLKTIISFLKLSVHYLALRLSDSFYERI